MTHEAETPEPQPQAPPAVGGEENLFVQSLRNVASICDGFDLHVEAAAIKAGAARLEGVEAENTALRAEVERWKAEAKEAEDRAQEWYERATYEIGAVPRFWDDRARAAEATLAALRAEVERVTRELTWAREMRVEAIRHWHAAEATLAAKRAKGRDKDAALKEFVRLKQSIMIDLRTAHRRGPGASSAMREDDADMVRDLERAFALAKAALTPTAAESTGGAG